MIFCREGALRAPSLQKIILELATPDGSPESATGITAWKLLFAHATNDSDEHLREWAQEQLKKIEEKNYGNGFGDK